MFDVMIKYFGHWIWYDRHLSLETICEYEKLLYSLYFANIVLIFAVIIALIFVLCRGQFRAGLHRIVKTQIVPALLAGYVLWVAQYIVQLSLFDSQKCRFPDNDPALLTILSAAVAFCFFLAGSSLLKLGEERFHHGLRLPTDAGIDMSRLSRILGNWVAPTCFAIVSILFAWSEVTWAKGHTGDTLGAAANCAGTLMFGLGLLREMNRAQRDIVGLVSAGSMLLYAAVQLGGIWGQLVFPQYFLSALLKIALLLTMLTFGALVKHGVAVRREERRDLVDLLIGLNSVLKHDLKQPLKPLDFRVALLVEKLAAVDRDLTIPVRNAVTSAEDFFKDWPEGLNPKPVDLKEFLTERRFTLNSSEGDDRYLVVAPPLFLQWAFDRLRENGEKASEERRVTVELEHGFNERKEPIILARVANSGAPIPQDTKLFQKPHGTWVARHLLELIEGKLELESTGPRKTVFRIELPTAYSPVRGVNSE
ncbi:MAG TPA: hypothetical protein VNW97_08290 [Candidatus Saccharimonadales bacterium]|nr:hypothetical protein [Candidatus Saccharimonadales bacterium]